MNDQEKCENFMRLKRHIVMLETTRLTEDKLQSYKAFFRLIRNEYPDLRLVNLESQDVFVRAAAIQGETYMQILENEFDPLIYLELLRCMDIILERLFEDDELADLMASIQF